MAMIMHPSTHPTPFKASRPPPSIPRPSPPACPCASSLAERASARHGRVPKLARPALRAALYVVAVPADTVTGAATVGHHLGDGQADPAHPAGLDGGPRPGGGPIAVVSPDQFPSGTQAIPGRPS